MNIHPDLVRLRAQYERIVADYTAGNIDDETAKAALMSMRVFDASGAAWGIDLDGMYIRQRTPSERAEVVPPTLFAIQQTGGEPRPGKAPWEEAREAGVPFARPVIDPGPPEAGAVSRAGDALREKAASVRSGKAWAALWRHKVTLLVAGGMLLLIMAASIAGGSDDPSDQTATTAGGSVTVSSVPQSGVALPDNGVVLAGVESLKNRAAATSTLGATGSAQSAFWNGLQAAGLSVEVKSIAPEGTGAMAVVAIKDTASTAEVGEVRISFSYTNAWQVSAWPDISAVVKNT